MGGRHETAERVLPAQQALGVERATGGEIHDRLIQERELVLLDRLPELCGDEQLVRRFLVDLVLEVVDRSTGAAPLRRVHRDVRAPEERRGVLAVARVERSADAGGELEDTAVDAAWNHYRIQYVSV